MRRLNYPSWVVNRRQVVESCLQSFAMVFLGVVLVTLIISGLVGPNWDLKYPHIQSPDLQFKYQVPISKIAKPSKAYSDKMAILVAVDRSGIIYVDYKKVTLNQLGQLVVRNKRFGSGQVYLKADHSLPYDVVMRVMRTCSSSGAKGIRILIEERPY